MKIRFSEEFVRAAEDTVLKAAAAGRVVDMWELCQRVQAENAPENIALEDIEVLVLKLLDERKVPVFIGRKRDEARPGDPFEDDTRLDEVNSLIARQRAFVDQLRAEGRDARTPERLLSEMLNVAEELKTPRGRANFRTR